MPFLFNKEKSIKGKFNMKLWNTLSKENKDKLAQVYKQLTGKKFIPPKVENLREISKLMKEKPNYSVDSQEREG